MGAKDPIRLGVLQDWGIGMPTTQDFYDALRLGFDEALRTGVVDRPVELVVREQAAYPLGPDEDVVKAWHSLVDDEAVIGTIGPQVTQANILVRDDVNERHIPTLAYCGTDDFYGEYCFTTPNGYFPDEVRVVLEYIKRRGHKSIGVLYDDNHQGHESLQNLRLAAPRMGIDIKIEVESFHSASPEGVRPHLEKIRAADADALVYVGNGNLVLSISPALKQMSWAPPRYMNISFIISHFYGDKGMAACEGWVGLDQYHEGNLEFQRLLQLFERRYGRRPEHMYTAMGWDNARIMAEGIRFAPELTGEGLKIGLERVRRLPAAIGEPGTLISFAKYDHRGFKGNYLLMRTVSDGFSYVAE